MSKTPVEVQFYLSRVSQLSVPHPSWAQIAPEPLANKVAFVSQLNISGLLGSTGPNLEVSNAPEIWCNQTVMSGGCL
jgi:hypothetical protein